MRTLDPLAELLAGVDTTITFGAWMAANPRDSITTEHVTGSDAYVCRVAVQRLGARPDAPRRYAVFDVPHIPPGEAFPSDTTHLAERVCLLHRLSIDAQTLDSARAVAIADSLAAAAAALPNAPAAQSSDTDPARWRRERTWTRGATRFSFELDTGAVDVDSTGAQHRLPRHVTLTATVPDSTIDDSEALRIEAPSAAGVDETAVTRLKETATDSALAMVDIPAIRSRLTTVLQAVRAFARPGIDANAHRTPALDSALAEALRLSRDSLPALSPARRAALLVGDDFVLSAYAADVDLESDTATVNRLRDVGVPYEADPLGASRVYMHSWLFDAYRADSTTPAGRLALRMLLANGWAMHANCADSSGAGDRVLEHGQAALRAGYDDPMIHYLLGVAHQDVVALAAGALPADYVDPKDFAPHAEAERALAIKEFRAALTSLADPALRRLAWTFAVRLMLRAQVPTSFVCIYD